MGEVSGAPQGSACCSAPRRHVALHSDLSKGSADWPCPPSRFSEGSNRVTTEFCSESSCPRSLRSGNVARMSVALLEPSRPACAHGNRRFSWCRVLFRLREGRLCLGSPVMQVDTAPLPLAHVRPLKLVSRASIAGGL